MTSQPLIYIIYLWPELKVMRVLSGYVVMCTCFGGKTRKHNVLVHLLGSIFYLRVL